MRPPAVSANQNEAEEVGTGRVHEKLHEDDRRQQARWKTVLYKVLPFLENGEAHLRQSCLSEGEVV